MNYISLFLPMVNMLIFLQMRLEEKEEWMFIKRLFGATTTKKPIVITEDNLIASITDPVISTFVPKSIQLTERNNLTVFKGRIIDGILQTPIEAKIKIFDNSTGEVNTTVTSNSATGKFLLSLPSGLNYGISVEAEGYLFHSENFNLPEGSAYNMVSKEIAANNDISRNTKKCVFETGKSEVKITLILN